MINHAGERGGSKTSSPKLSLQGISPSNAFELSEFEIDIYEIILSNPKKYPRLHKGILR